MKEGFGEMPARPPEERPPSEPSDKEEAEREDQAQAQEPAESPAASALEKAEARGKELEEKIRSYEGKIDKIRHSKWNDPRIKFKLQAHERNREKLRKELEVLRGGMQELRARRDAPPVSASEVMDAEPEEEPTEDLSYEERFERTLKGRLDQMAGGWVESGVDGLESYMLTPTPNGGATVTVQPEGITGKGKWKADFSMNKDGLLMGDADEWEFIGGVEKADALKEEIVANAEQYLLSENPKVPEGWVHVNKSFIDSDEGEPRELKFEPKEEKKERRPDYMKERIDNLHRLRSRGDAIVGFINMEEEEVEKSRKWAEAYHGVVFPGVVALENPYIGHAFYIVKIPMVDVESMPTGGPELQEWINKQEFMESFPKKRSVLIEEMGAVKKVHSGNWMKNVEKAIDTAVREQAAQG